MIKTVLTQYADDTTVILDGYEDSLNETLYELDEFAKKSASQKHM